MGLGPLLSRATTGPDLAREPESQVEESESRKGYSTGEEVDLQKHHKCKSGEGNELNPRRLLIHESYKNEKRGVEKNHNTKPLSTIDL
jgi:hypothetical protein